ncbi:agmatine deiminase family protein [Microbacterium sp. EYE_5]|uniref:agmatine deiminase family protein n=1 Tax=unclassified Microbacterium TaxID=2609290 RepID=UPI00200419D6|nr:MULTISPECIES: agmatine deiminase family protein [unclassified Microbacterium]MCK6080027.1 agmatine deiminase family protein [Microbacterium sp. EYE_382]MCK6085298.1 agmatine deiminase family protein [Microbacterium sp. EYE_384]MCK6122477.1 agmatine deiminase family protein [Microbacterium sp. EYE_80]MCK6126061.1 agmatine deiminase family protein [Microbacterium sp. EYE_79]MCK6140982.1 agmatine deiminase family protein [Microbacterium sp. EYE_39]
MAWRMPSETAPHERTWMAFPREGVTLGETAAEREEGYATWAAVAAAVARFEPVTMVVDPSETGRARRMLPAEVTLLEAPVDEYWMRDHGPTFVVDDERPGALGAVDWIFNGWGAPEWAQWQDSAAHARIIAAEVGAELVSSVLVNEGGGIHVDGEGTVLLTGTVQLDPRRNPFADRARVEAEMARTLGTTRAVWLSRGLTRDYDDFGTNGHVDIVATIPSPGRILLHDQRDASHPDHAVTAQLRAELEEQTDAAGRRFEIVALPAPETLTDAHGPVDWSYVNHLVVNGGVIACGFGEEQADAQARAILAEAYPGREVVTVDARPLFDRGGGIHCITQQQPKVTR